jgi:hypothetical protein
MNKIKLLHISFLKKEFDCIPHDEQAFLLQVGGLIHEIISLQKYIMMSSRGVDDPVQRTAENAQAMYFCRMLAGCLYEGWELLTKRHNEYRIIRAKYKPKLDEIAQEALKKLERYFNNSNNACERIRNKFSHHHDYGEILKMLKKWPEDDKLEIYISELLGNCRYMASDIVTNLAMLGTTDQIDFEIMLPELIKEILGIAKAFMELVSEYLSLILQEITKKTGIKGKWIEITNVASLNEVRILYFVVE